ncbi:MAG: DUF2953 domain-containing protein [Lachnospiraceae bacterium]|nr:DUF2953 domain-containing protein [Lachnospiraceae bacterium]
MLHIILLILKIIGIVLGVLLGTVLLVLCMALFVPVHYQIEAKRTEGEGNPPIEAAAKITWLLHFINLKVSYPAEVYLKARVMIFPIFQLPPKPQKEKRKKAAKQKENTESESRKKTDREKTAEETKETDHGKEMSGTDKTVEREQTLTKDASWNETVCPETENESKSLWERVLQFFHKVIQFFQNIRYTIAGICAKIKEICENIEYYLNVIKSDTFQKAFLLCKNELGDVFRYIMPRRLNADITVGMEDPATTGQILSYYGILYPLIGNHVTVTGDFEKKRLEGQIFIKGKIKLFKLLKAGIRIYFNKDIKRLLKLFKKEEL